MEEGRAKQKSSRFLILLSSENITLRTPIALALIDKTNPGARQTRCGGQLARLAFSLGQVAFEWRSMPTLVTIQVEEKFEASSSIFRAHSHLNSYTVAG